MLRLHILASGSGGNAAIVENAVTGEGVLVDCGICKRDFFARAEEAGFNLEKLRAVVITHDHGDHTKGLGVVLRGLAKAGAHPAVCASEAVFAASAPLREAVASVGAAFEPFDGGDRLDLAGLAVRPFRTSHDAADSYGFRFEERGSGCDSLGYMTDTGVVTDAAWEALSGVHLLALESNHDARMLQAGPYPYVIKQRICPTTRRARPWIPWLTKTCARWRRCTSPRRTTPTGSRATPLRPSSPSAAFPRRSLSPSKIAS